MGAQPSRRTLTFFELQNGAGRFHSGGSLEKGYQKVEDLSSISYHRSGRTRSIRETISSSERGISFSSHQFTVDMMAPA